MTAAKDSIEDFQLGVRYEALRDSLMGEVARHLTAVDAAPDGPDVALHQEAVEKLVAARRRLDPKDASAIEIAELIMDSYRDKVPADAR